jgi:hypothetical protein
VTNRATAARCVNYASTTGGPIAEPDVAVVMIPVVAAITIAIAGAMRRT